MRQLLLPYDPPITLAEKDQTAIKVLQAVEKFLEFASVADLRQLLAANGIDIPET